MFVTYLLCGITNILGCWQLEESSVYFINKQKKYNLVSKEVSNVPPFVTFLYNGKGTIDYCNGKRIPFVWQQESNNSIRVTCNDSIDNKSFYFEIMDDSLVLAESNGKCIIHKYLLRQTKIKIEEYERNKIKISNVEYNSLTENNPFMDLACFVAEGYEKDNVTLQIGGQEYMEIIHGIPNTQYVVFVKSSNNQQNIPCYLVTNVQSNNGIIIYANYIKHIDLQDSPR